MNRTVLTFALVLVGCRGTSSTTAESLRSGDVTGSTTEQIATTCYAGTETVEEAAQRRTARVILVHEVDRDARTIVQRRWSALDPEDEHVVRFMVGTEGQSFEIDNEGIRGQGSFTGEQWAWTGYRAQLSGDGVTVELIGELSAQAHSFNVRVNRAGKLWRSRRVELSPFGCAALAKERQALDDTDPQASRACFAGIESEFGKPERVVFEQIIEPERIRIRRWSAAGASLQEFSIDGASFAYTSPAHPGVSGSGRLIGGPGAWTGYTWSSAVGDFDISAEGTLGGSRMTRTIAVQRKGFAPREDPAKLEADAFPCGDRDERIAELRGAR